MAPEGTRRRKNSDPDKANIMKFKKGAFHLAKLAQTEIVPVIITGSHRIGGKNPVMPKPGCLYIKVCDPIPLDIINGKEVDDLISYTHQRFIDEATPKTDKEIYGKAYTGWTYLLIYIAYNLTCIWFFYKLFL